MTEDFEQKNAILSAIIDSSEDAIISKDLNGYITSWNKAAETMFGYTEAEITGEHISVLIPKDRLSEEQMIISNLRQGKRIMHYETIRLSKTGKELYISLSVSPIKNSAGLVVGASKIARDITRQKQVEASLKRYTEQLELLNLIGQTIAMELDVNKIVERVTDATTRISGAEFGAFFYNKVDAKGETYMLYHLSGAPREAFEKFGMPRNTEIFKTTFDGLGVLRSDDITKDSRYGKNKPHKGMPEGHFPVVSYMAVPVVSKSGVVIGGLFFGHPKAGMFTEEHEKIVVAISHQASIGLENAKLYEEINSLNKKKDEFIGFASHELKTPLTTISGYTQIVQVSPAMLPELIPKISRQVDKLSAIIGDLLDISKIEANKFDLNYARTSLVNLIKEAVEAGKQHAESHEVIFELPAEDIMVTVDAQKMGQLLINLVTNAIKYSPDADKILVVATLLGDQVEVSIRDWGIGIDQLHLEKIFNRFYRVQATQNKTQGLGVGLYLAQEVIEAHSGKIWLESELGKGSVFHISFPIENYRPK
ncbi:hypothetical protein BH11BAC4_BH11BAC4_25880 [soil metagenome]